MTTEVESTHMGGQVSSYEEKPIRYKITIDFPGDVFLSNEALEASLVAAIHRMAIQGWREGVLLLDGKQLPTSSFKIEQYLTDKAQKEAVERHHLNYVLPHQREVQLQKALDAYSFDDDIVIEMDGWQYMIPGDEYSRILYIENPDGGDSLKKLFLVQFQPNSDVIADITVRSFS